MEFVYKLFKYSYTRDAQGSTDRGEEYALMHVPADASFNNNRSTLMNARHKKWYHEIDIESVVDLTIKF